MIFFFRVDASDKIGLGHFMRCLNLAEQLLVRGGIVKFICKSYGKNQSEILKKKKIPLIPLSREVRCNIEISNKDSNFTVFPEKDDALETLSKIKNYELSCLIVDSYFLGFDWESLVRPYVNKLIVIEDLTNRKHLCDILIDQNYSSNKQNYYDNLVPKFCRKFLGPDYALINKRYSKAPKKSYNAQTKIRRILISFGGADLDNMTSLTLEALNDPIFKYIEVWVVVSKYHPLIKKIKSQAKERPNTKLYNIQPNLVNFFIKSCITIGAGGSTTWERLCIGIPSILICLAENQKQNILSLAQENYVFNAGEVNEMSASKISKIIRDALEQKECLSTMSNKGKLLVDGYGSMRTAEILLPSSKDDLVLRETFLDDMNMYFKWVNDPAVRKQSKKSDYITYKEHKEWFIESIKNSSTYLFILLANNLPVGQIRFNLFNDISIIDYSIDKLFRGKGLAKELVKQGIFALNDIKPCKLYAEVKRNNKASCATFSALGFQEESNLNKEIKNFTFDTLKFIKRFQI